MSGSQVLKLDVLDGNEHRIASKEGDGLPNYFQKGEIMEYYVRAEKANDTIRNHLALADTSNYYDV